MVFPIMEYVHQLRDTAMTGRDRQTVADMAIENCGGADDMFAIMRQNNISADAEVAGVELQDSSVSEQRTVDYMRFQGASPACNSGDEAEALTIDDESENVVTENNEIITA